ncbi:MAG: hypothetical protein EXR07_16655 [Acetobacteraceae bacterium]|nr:hypothetical protein [Acetobacteraceae bacterium]
MTEIRDQGLDAAGGKIIGVYAKQPPHFAIYRTNERVMVHFADADDEAKHQGAILAPLNPMRGAINGLIDAWRFSRRQRLQARASRYDRRIADALGIALQDDAAGALTVLTGIKGDILDDRTSWARFQYLIAASIVSAGVILLVWAVTCPWLAPAGGLSKLVGVLWLSLAGGTIGAFFSIAIAIRKRTVLTDLHWVDNAADAVLRVVIGAIAAGVLISLVQLNAINITIGGLKSPVDLAENWLYALVLAVVAGFSERLIPDLLEKSAAAVGPAPRQAPAAGPKPPLNGGTRVGAPPAPDVMHDHRAAEDLYRLEDCLCDKAVQPHEVTSDADLPAASGGVAAPRVPAVTGA